MTERRGVTRRTVTRSAVAGFALAGAPWWPRRAVAIEPIKIGMPLAQTGPLGSVGQQLKRGGELWAKVHNAKGGLIGRQIQLLIEDTGGNPADAVRKAQEMVERDGCNIFTGITLSSEALAVVPKLEEWKAIFVSSDNGDGRLTAESFVPNFFRSNISAPMGARAVSLFLRESEWQNVYAIGMDYAWGRNSVQVFESEMRRAKKNFIGSVFSPIGTKDFSTYITKIRQSAAEAVYITMAGDDYNAFLAQAAQYRLPEKVQLLSEVVDLTVPRAVGDAALGLISSMRYCFRLDNPANKEFVTLWQKEYDTVPDNNEGEQWQALRCRRRHREGREHRHRRLAQRAGNGSDRRHQGPCRDPQMRPSGSASRLHGQARKGRRVLLPGAADHRDLPRRQDDARLQQDDLRRLNR
jgi:branched-chain amino acid transport system substrate-binding protein